MKKVKLLFALLIAFVLLAACSGNDEATDGANEQEPQASETETTEGEVDEELEAAKAMFEPLGEMPIPEDNPMSDEKVELGAQLYVDNRLSGDNSRSCMFCHSIPNGYGDGQKTFTLFGETEPNGGPRNSPTVINAGYYEELFWDGRAGSLEEQALGPITSEVEMNQDLDELVEELKAVPGYVEQFDNVFDDGITADNIAKAIAAFERTIVITDTAFDRYLQGDEDAISDEAKEGMKLYVGKANCISCHSGPLLSDHNYHNLGIEGDEGRYAITGDEKDMGAFRTPALRGVSHTAPYMHDGSIETLREVIEFYNEGGGPDEENKSPLIEPLGLTDEEIDQLVAFLESMAGEVPEFDIPEVPNGN